MKTKSGNAIFSIGIGTWNIGGGFELKPDEKYKGAYALTDNEDREVEALRYSLSKGQNHIDCAELYGAFHTDEVVGKALVDQKREDIFIADKLWKTSVATGKVRATVEQMLKKLDTDYLDMLYIHAPWEGVPWKEAIPQIDDLIDEGVVLNFGVSNFSVEQMKEAQALAKHPIVANQMEYNVLYKDQVDRAFIDFCRENDIQVVAYQPIKRQEVYENPTIIEIAVSHNASPAQVALAWLLAKDILPIPKAVQKQHIDENIAAVELSLSDDELGQLDKL